MRSSCLLLRSARPHCDARGATDAYLLRPSLPVTTRSLEAALREALTFGAEAVRTYAG